MEKNKAIKVKKKDQKLFEELMGYEADVDRRIATLLNEVEHWRNEEGRNHNSLWDDIIKKYKLDLSKGIWCYNKVTKTLSIKPKTCREKYDEIDKEKEKTEWEDRERLVDKMIELKKTFQ